MKLFSGACAIALLLLTSARAEITVIREYLMGDADPGAVIGTVVTTSRDTASGQNLNVSGSPVYYRAAGRPQFGNSGTSQPGVSMEFDGGATLKATGLAGLVDNFGVEAWVRPSGTSAGYPVYNGNVASDGWGLSAGGSAAGVYGGQSSGLNPVAPGSASVAQNEWHHVALVRDGGVTTVRVDGRLISPWSVTAPPFAPTPQLVVGQLFSGLIDEVRIFTFVPGQFKATDLSYPVAPVTPLELGLLGGNVRLRWPGSTPAPLLETATSLVSGSWTVMADGTAPMVNSLNELSLPLAEPRRFFRLVYRSPDWRPAVGLIGTGAFATFSYEDFGEVARLSRNVRGSITQTLDASTSYDPATGDASRISYQWELYAPRFYASQLGVSADAPYGVRGLSGMATAAFKIAPDSLPSLAPDAADPEAQWWRVKLTMTHQPFDPSSPFPQDSTVWFRFRYVQSRVTLENAVTHLSLTETSPLVNFPNAIYADRAYTEAVR